MAEKPFGEGLPSFSDVTYKKHFDELDGQAAVTVRYGCADSDFALRLYYIFNGWFDRYLPKHRYIVKNIGSPNAVYLGIMKINGISIDITFMLKRKAEAESELERIRKDIKFIIGDVDIGANCSTFLTKAGKKWYDITVSNILTNEKYTGDAILQKTYVLDCISKKRCVNNGELPKYLVKGHHEPIISHSEFDRVQAEMARRKSKRKIAEKLTKTENGKYSAKFALSELLICGECGTPYR